MIVRLFCFAFLKAYPRLVAFGLALDALPLASEVALTGAVLRYERHKRRRLV